MERTKIGLHPPNTFVTTTCDRRTPEKEIQARPHYSTAEPESPKKRYPHDGSRGKKIPGGQEKQKEGEENEKKSQTHPSEPPPPKDSHLCLSRKDTEETDSRQPHEAKK